MEYRTFATERLWIRPTDVEDAEFILTLFNTPKWLRYIGDRQVRTEEDARRYISEKMIPQLHRLGYSNYTVIRKADNRKLGACGLYDRAGLEGIDIGFSFLPEYENLGYAYEASSRLLKAAFNDFDISVVSAITTKDNSSSQRLLQKLGLHLSGTMTLPNDDEELLVFSRQSCRYSPLVERRVQ